MPVPSSTNSGNLVATHLPGIFTVATLPVLTGVPAGSISAYASDGGIQIWGGSAWNPLATTGIALPTGDQLVGSRDTSPFREGSWSLTASGQLYTLLGDFAMKYWSHNVPLNPSTGDFLGRDDAGPCALITFTEGIGINAPKYAMWSCPTGLAGAVPGTFTKVFEVDLTTGIVTLGNAQLLATNIALTNNAGAQAATLTNGPTAGNPTKWIPINDNGTIRNIPAW